MHLSAFDRLFWATGFVGQIILLVVLFARDRARTFPVFTASTANSFLSTFLMYFVYVFASRRSYYYGFWVVSSTSMLFQLGVMYEMSSHLFAPLGRWAPDAKSSFIRIVGISILVDIVLTALCSPAKSTLMQTLVTRGTFFSSTLMTELFVGLVMLASTGGFPWKTHVGRITEGLGAYCFIGVLFDTATSGMGWAHQGNTIHALSLVRIAAYLCTLTYWIVCLWHEAPEPRTLSEPMRAQIFGLQRQLEYDLGRIRGWRKV
jgi:hypothetical protein